MNTEKYERSALSQYYFQNNNQCQTTSGKIYEHKTDGSDLSMTAGGRSDINRKHDGWGRHISKHTVVGAAHQ